MYLCLWKWRLSVSFDLEAQIQCCSLLYSYRDANAIWERFKSSSSVPAHPLLIFPFTPHPHPPGGGGGCESKRVWQSHLREFDLTTQRDGEAHTLISREDWDGRDLANLVTSGVSDAWSVKIRLGYHSPTSAAVFRRFGHWERVNIYVLHRWVFRGLIMLNLAPPPRPSRHGFR